MLPNALRKKPEAEVSFLFVFPPFAAVLRPHQGDVHGGLLAVAGGAGAGSLHSHILQVLFGLKKKKNYNQRMFCNCHKTLAGAAMFGCEVKMSR